MRREEAGRGACPPPAKRLLNNGFSGVNLSCKPGNVRPKRRCESGLEPATLDGQSPKVRSHFDDPGLRAGDHPVPSVQLPVWDSPRLTRRLRLIAATRSERPSWFLSTPRKRTRRCRSATNQAIERSTIGRSYR